MIICINGPPGSGKTTAADVLCRDHGAIRLDLSQPFKKFIDWCYGIPPEVSKQHKDTKNFFAGRGGDKFLSLRDIQIGVASVLEYGDPHVWIKIAVRGIKRDKTYVLDSIGKIAQWNWLAGALPAEELMVWGIRDGDQFKCDQSRIGLWKDGRERVEGTIVKPSLYISTQNTHPSRRTRGTLEDYERRVSEDYLVSMDLMKKRRGA